MHRRWQNQQAFAPVTCRAQITHSSYPCMDIYLAFDHWCLPFLQWSGRNPRWQHFGYILFVKFPQASRTPQEATHCWRPWPLSTQNELTISPSSSTGHLYMDHLISIAILLLVWLLFPSCNSFLFITQLAGFLAFFVLLVVRKLALLLPFSLLFVSLILIQCLKSCVWSSKLCHLLSHFMNFSYLIKYSGFRWITWHGRCIEIVLQMRMLVLGIVVHVVTIGISDSCINLQGIFIDL